MDSSTGKAPNIFYVLILSAWCRSYWWRQQYDPGSSSLAWVSAGAAPLFQELQHILVPAERDKLIAAYSEAPVQFTEDALVMILGFVFAG